MPIPKDFDDTNDKFIDIVLANDWDFPVVVDEQPMPDMFSTGFVVLPVPHEIILFWQELLDTQGDDGNFFQE